MIAARRPTHEGLAPFGEARHSPDRVTVDAAKTKSALVRGRPDEASSRMPISRAGTPGAQRKPSLRLELATGLVGPHGDSVGWVPVGGSRHRLRQKWWARSSGAAKGPRTLTGVAHMPSSGKGEANAEAHVSLVGKLSFGERVEWAGQWEYAPGTQLKVSTSCLLDERARAGDLSRAEERPAAL